MFEISAAALLTGAAGFGLGLCGALSLLRTARLRALADGKVTGYEFDGEGVVPVVEFVGADGTKGRFRAVHDGYLKRGKRSQFVLTRTVRNMPASTRSWAAISDRSWPCCSRLS